MNILTDIAQHLLTNDIPSEIDGISNVERVSFIMEVFESNCLDLNAAFPYEEALQSDDLIAVLAATHLCKLQYQFMHACRYAEIITQEDAEIQDSSFILMLHKMHWHLSYLERGIPTPPFGFIN